MRRALGKGLAQLLGEATPVGGATEVPVSSLTPNPDQPRRHFDEIALQELAQSIAELGLLQPILVRPAGENKYEIIAGERRWRAAQIAGLTMVPVTIREALGDQGLLVALVENVQREDISALECALAYQRLAADFGLKQEEIAQRVGKSRTAIANTVRLLRLPDPILQALAEGAISEGHARALLAFDSAKEQVDICTKIIREGLSVRQVEQLAKTRDAKEEPKQVKRAKREVDPDWIALEEALSVYFSTPAKLSRGEVGGKLTLEFYSDEELERILEILGVHL